MHYYNEHDRYAAAWLRELIADGQIPKGEIDERSIVDVQPGDLAGFVSCHFFAGIGGWPYALKLAGWPDDRPAWTGSCPCQPFSSAGKQKGLADERHLWPAWFRLIRECRPPVVFGEQVEAAVRHGWLDGVFADLEREGYACGATVLGAHSVRAPHIRQRLYLVADSHQSGCDQWARSGEQSIRNEDSRVVRPANPKIAVRMRDSGVEKPDRELCQCRQSEERIELCGAKGDEGSNYHVDRRGASDGNRLGFATGEQAGRTGQPQQDGTWSDFDLIPCADGKVRRVESGTFPLVARLSDIVVPSGYPSLSYVQATAEGRQMRLRGYGNSIVPQCAAEFIKLFLDIGAEGEEQP